jgi:hypothetical protein
MRETIIGTLHLSRPIRLDQKRELEIDLATFDHGVSSPYRTL